MKIKNFFLILSAFALFFTGCEKDEFFTETTNNAALKKAVVKEVPIKALDAYVVVTDFFNDFPSQGICGGNMTHLGKLKADKSIWYTVNVDVIDSEMPWILLWTQEGDWCAANGDLLHWSIVTTVDMMNQTVSGTALFDGGTGRFVNASGYFNLAGHPDPDNPTTRFIVDSGVGMISNVGSGK
jgi:hypothetical protein